MGGSIGAKKGGAFAVGNHVKSGSAVNETIERELPLLQAYMRIDL